jgi:hypothetical protein
VNPGAALPFLELKGPQKRDKSSLFQFTASHLASRGFIWLTMVPAGPILPKN